jgi:hypothetical protein
MTAIISSSGRVASRVANQTNSRIGIVSSCTMAMRARHGRIEQRDTIRVLEQLHGEFPRPVLQQSCVEERRAYADASRQQDDR